MGGGDIRAGRHVPDPGGHRSPWPCRGTQALARQTRRRHSSPACRFAERSSPHGCAWNRCPSPPRGDRRSAQGLTVSDSTDRLTAHAKQSGLNELLCFGIIRAHGPKQLRNEVRFDHASPSGKRTTASSPPSGKLRSTTEPPCAWMMDRAMARPRPTPPVSRLRELSNRTKGSNTASS